MKKKITIAIVTQKGGCTKSTSTLITAGIFHYKLEKKVAIVDYDNQSSISETRHEDEQVVLQNENLASAIREQGISKYEIVRGNPYAADRLSVNDIVSVFDDDTDFIFFDYPGVWKKMNEDEDEDAYDRMIDAIIDDYRNIDVLIVPITFSEMDNRSTLRFMYELVLKYKVQPKILCNFHTKVDRQLPQWKELLNIKKETFAELGFEQFETYIPNLKIFNAGLSVESVSKNKKIDCLLNTVILPNNTDLLRSNYLDFAEELLTKIEKVFDYE